MGANASVIDSNDFDGSVTVGSGLTTSLSGGSVEGAQGYAGIGGFSGDFYRNATGILFGANISPVATKLTITDLTAHSSVSIGGLLAVIDSWDSNNGSCCIPDLLQVKVDGTTLFTATFNNVLGTNNTVFGTQLTTGGSSGAYPHLGFNPSWDDQAFDFTGFSPLTNIAHTDSTLDIEFVAAGAGWQGGIDESWAIENLVVSADVASVPGPATLGLFGLGLLILGFKQRQRL